jgi:aquaporin rerated protein, other eukaryote
MLMVAIIGEFVGTILFLFLAFAGTQVANDLTKANTETTDGTAVTQTNLNQLIFISLSFGLSVTVNAWVFFRISGGLFNPAVRIFLALNGGYNV